MKTKLLKKVRRDYEICAVYANTGRIGIARYDLYCKGKLIDFTYYEDRISNLILDHLFKRYNRERRVNKGKKIWWIQNK